MSKRKQKEKVRVSRLIRIREDLYQFLRGENEALETLSDTLSRIINETGKFSKKGNSMKTFILLMALGFLTACGGKGSGDLPALADTNAVYFQAPSTAACNALEAQVNTRKTVNVAYGTLGYMSFPADSAPVFHFTDHDAVQPDGTLLIVDNTPTTYCTLTVQNGIVRSVAY